ncbi:hypothetical protein RKE29_02180 [Streptomyces sp. B1866]|uniref:hypothetical protein n=1 Tax=Streptomyces sp. B1866 TaxID=3075431 RepID=UPI00288E71E8|nr:hypothetical protein [Streptomyces sp. B1866]MDT3395469.1 hypothetical protein [Streptomyces sp. B1866]
MKRTAYQTFLADQTLAAAAEAAALPGQVPVAITTVDGGRCTWCDCPDGPDSPHNQRGYQCGGCPAPAAVVVSVHTGPELRYDFPACERHQADIVAAVAYTVGGQR